MTTPASGPVLGGSTSFPVLSARYEMDVASTGIKKKPHLGECQIGLLSYFQNVFDLGIRKLCSAVIFSKEEPNAALSFAVLNIVGLRSDKNVVRVYTKFHIAFMASNKAIRYRALEKFISNAMCRILAAFKFDTAISSISALAAGPNPTSTFIHPDAAHKALNSRLFGLIPRHRCKPFDISKGLYAPCGRISTAENRCL